MSFSFRRSEPPARELPLRLRFETADQAAEMARRRLPRLMYQRIMSGSERNITYQANLSAFEQVSFRPHNAAAPLQRDLQTSVLGIPLSMPVILAPVGALRLLHPGGVLAAACAAGEAGTVLASSPASGHTIEEVAAATSAPLWWQLSVSGGREAAEATIRKAAALGFRALVITVDSPVKPKGRAVHLNSRTAAELGPDLIRHPRWTANFIRDGMRLSVANAALGAGSPGAARPVVWDDFRWIRDQWKGPVVVKGVTTADDARRAVDVGAAAVVVSNHGGIALDGAPATLRALPSVAAAVGGQVEVLFDGGVRWGSDVVKALALGARAALLGRAYMMGLAVGGVAGVQQILEIFRIDIDRTLAFLGCPAVGDLDDSYVDARNLNPA
jgi:isopentenyl diphosphate isomerase/L-lactate dehydrogenase-like FMN-dependent dehydrogenase